jgi:hypothetical protein
MASPAMTPVPGTRVRERSSSTGDHWSVRADHLGAFRRLITASIGVAHLTEVHVRIERWRRPHRGWAGSPGIDGVDGVSMVPKGDGVDVSLTLRERHDAAVVLSAVLRMLQPTVSGFPSVTWTTDVPAAGLLAEQVRDVQEDGDIDEHVRRADVLLVGGGADATAVSAELAERLVHVREGRWGDREVRIDPTIHRPHGRASDAIGEIVDAATITRRFGPQIDMLDVKPLRAISAVTGVSSLDADLRAQLAALGVIGVESEAELPAADDYLGWQRMSVDGRRDALRDFSPQPAVTAWPSVSVLLSTHRPERLDHALSMVRRQDYPHLQLVLVLHGDESDVAQHAPRVRSLLEGWEGEWVLIGVPAEHTLGHALIAASARADGELLTKMDDDDYYAATHIWDLVLARMYSGAQIVGKALDWVYLEGVDTTVFRPTYPAERFARFVAGGTICISAGDLAQVGGWRSLPRSVDKGLLDRVLQSGGLVYRAHGLGYVYVRHGSDKAANTSPVAEEHFLTKTVTEYPGLVRSSALGTE